MIEKEPKKKTPIAMVAFYFLIVFEIIYMITPFGAYYYSVYGKGLNFLNEYAATKWLSAFFLPHIVTETESSLLNFYLNYLHPSGWILGFIGLGVFIIGATQIYFGKFRKKTAIIGGIYKYIRHPQYTGLIVSGLGLLLVWPRMIVLTMFGFMLVVYYQLAKSEEKECEEKFGQPYTDYLQRTGRFFPKLKIQLTNFNYSEKIKPFFKFIIFTSIIGLIIFFGLLLRIYSVKNLYSIPVEKGVCISVNSFDLNEMKDISNIIINDSYVKNNLDGKLLASEQKLIFYFMPAEWYFSDLPMLVPKDKQGHFKPGNYNSEYLKILINITNSDCSSAYDILLNSSILEPVISVYWNRQTKQIYKYEETPSNVRWGKIPTPKF